jgi:plasmid stabilization system protein ParE
MGYRLIVTKNADELLDKIIYHLVFRLKNEVAAKHLLDKIDSIYDRLEINPEQFPLSRDIFLTKKGYREAIVSDMNYVIVFAIGSDVVNVVGIFHQLENYQKKL